MEIGHTLFVKEDFIVAGYKGGEFQGGPFLITTSLESFSEHLKTDSEKLYYGYHAGGCCKIQALCEKMGDRNNGC